MQQFGRVPLGACFLPVYKSFLPTLAGECEAPELVDRFFTSNTIGA